MCEIIDIVCIIQKDANLVGSLSGIVTIHFSLYSVNILYFRKDIGFLLNILEINVWKYCIKKMIICWLVLFLLSTFLGRFFIMVYLKVCIIIEDTVYFSLDFAI